MSAKIDEIEELKNADRVFDADSAIGIFRNGTRAELFRWVKAVHDVLAELAPLDCAGSYHDQFEFA